MAHTLKHHLRVFLCHASGDKPAVRNLYKRLIAEGIDAWLDQEKLLPGQDWRIEIPLAVRQADVVVICLSNKSITKEGYVQTEIEFALDIAKEKPEGTIFLIPTRLEDCPVPDRLSRWQWVDLFNVNGYEQLMRSLHVRAEKIGALLENPTYFDAELDQRIEQLYAEGSAALWVEDWDKACYRFQTILRDQPYHVQAAAKLEEAKRQKYLSRLYAQAIEAQKNEDWQTVIEALEKLSEEQTDYKDVTTLLKNAQKKNRVARLYEEARKLYEAQQWQAVIRIFEHITAIEPDYQDHEGLLALAENKVAELKRFNELNNLYVHGVQELDSSHWHEAYELFKQIQKTEPGFQETERLLAMAEGEVKKAEEKKWREDQIKILYGHASSLAGSRMWRDALNKIDEIRQLDENFSDPDQIFKQAQEELERQKREFENQNKLKEMYTEATRLLHDKKYQEALEKWREILTLDAEYPDPQKVQLISKKKLGELTRSGFPKKSIGKNKLVLIGAGIFVAISLLLIFWLIPALQVIEPPATTLTSFPTLTQIPTPTILMLIDEQFDKSQYDGTLNQNLWTVSGETNPQVVNHSQSNGVLVSVMQTLESQDSEIHSTQGWAISEIGYSEWRVKFDETVEGAWASSSLGLSAESGARFACDLKFHLGDEGLNCLIFKSGEDINRLMSNIPLAPNTWYVLRIAVIDDPLEFKVYLDDQPVLEHVVIDSESWEGNQVHIYSILAGDNLRNAITTRIDYIAVTGR